jgi:flagellar basal-body rod protein FlgB
LNAEERLSMQIETRLSDQLSRYLDLAVSETKVTAANMANIDTPGYRTQGFDFEAEMRKALATFDSRKAFPLQIQDVDGMISRPDGNNVSMDREGLNMAEAQLKFKTGVALMRLENQRVMDAIHADK